MTATLPRVGPPSRWRTSGELSWLEAPLPGARRPPSARGSAGSARAPYESLNLGILTDDDPDRVRATAACWRRRSAGTPAAIAMGRQVHGAEVQVHATARRPHSAAGSWREVDAQVTDHADVTPLVLVADCVPLALCGAGRRGGGPLRLARRGRRASSSARSRRSRRCGSGPARSQPRSGPASARAATRSAPRCVERFARADTRRRAAAEARPAAGRARRARAAACGVDGDRRRRALRELQPELFFSHRRDGGVTGRQAGAGLARLLEQRRRRAGAGERWPRSASAIAAACARAGRDPARSRSWRRPSTCRSS